MLARARFLISNFSYFLFYFLHFFRLSFFREFCGLEIVSATPKCFFFNVPTRFLETFFFFTCASEFCTFHLNWSSTHSHTQKLVESSWKFSTRRKKFFRTAFFPLSSFNTICGRAITSLSCGFFLLFFFCFSFSSFRSFFFGLKILYRLVTSVGGCRRQAIAGDCVGCLF